MCVASAAVITSVSAQVQAKTPRPDKLRVLYWNIQNGMWADQHNNYDNFVNWVKEYDPDVCIWAEAKSRYISHQNVRMKPEDDSRYWVHNYILENTP